MVHIELVAVLQRDGDLSDHGHGLVDLDGLPFALLVDVGERAPVDPLAHDHEVRRSRGLALHDRLGAEDVEDRDDAAVIDGGGPAGGRLGRVGALVLRGDEPQRDRAVEHGIEALPQLDDTGLGDQHVEDVAADPLVAHPSRVRASVASSPDERSRRLSTLRWTSWTTSPTSWMRMAHAAAR